jgi:hypothetical protein
MLRPGLETSQVVAVQQLINAIQAVGNAEFFRQNALSVFATKGAHTIVVGWSRSKAIQKGTRLKRIEAGLGATTPGWPQHVNAVIPIGVAPALDKAAAATDHLLNRRRLMPFDREQHHTIPIPLFGVIGCACALLKIRHITGPSFANVHVKASLLEENFSMTEHTRSRNPNTRLTRTRFAWDWYYYGGDMTPTHFMKRLMNI